MDVKRKSVTLSIINVDYIDSLCEEQNTNNFSKVLNQVVDERRMNEEFDSCQNKF